MSAFNSFAFLGSAFLTSAPVSGTTYSYAGTGSFTGAGQAAARRFFSRSSSGGVSLSGAAVTSKTTAAVAGTFSYSSSGGVSASSSAVLRRVRAASTAGICSLSGSGGYKRVRPVISIGAVTTSGAAILRGLRKLTGSGSASLGGTAAFSYVSPTAGRTYDYRPVGLLISVSGSAVVVARRSYIFVPSGGLLAAGQCWFDVITQSRKNTVYIPYGDRTVDIAAATRAFSIAGEDREFRITH